MQEVLRESRALSLLAGGGEGQEPEHEEPEPIRAAEPKRVQSAVPTGR